MIDYQINTMGSYTVQIKDNLPSIKGTLKWNYSDIYPIEGEEE